MRIGTQYNIILFVMQLVQMSQTCADVGWNAVQYSLFCYAACANEEQ